MTSPLETELRSALAQRAGDVPLDSIERAESASDGAQDRQADAACGFLSLLQGKVRTHLADHCGLVAHFDRAVARNVQKVSDKHCSLVFRNRLGRVG